MILSIPKHFVEDASMHTSYDRHSVYKHTINFISDKHMISLHDKTRSLSPMGIRLSASEEAFDEMKEKIHSVTLTPTHIILNGQSIDYDKVMFTHHDLKEDIQSKNKLNETMSRDLYKSIYRQIPDLNYPSHQLLGKKLNQNVEILKTVLLNPSNNEHAIQSAVEGLIGLGEGLTPSGDDILTGVLAGLLMQDEQALFNVLKSSVVSAINNDQTTIVSKEFLFYASKGVFIGELITLYNKKIMFRSVDATIDKILSMGHSSGADLLKGLALALSLGGINYDS